MREASTNAPRAQPFSPASGAFSGKVESDFPFENATMQKYRADRQ
jgi:hypothetical protein